MQKHSWFKMPLFSLAFISVSLFTTQSFAKQYYKWVDANGSTHYTTTPPPKNVKKQGKVETYGAARNTYVAPTSNNTSTPPNNDTNQQSNQQQNLPVASAPVVQNVQSPEEAPR